MKRSGLLIIQAETMPRHSDSRQRLLQIATELIWESSYAHASVDRICERADIKKGSFYHHFASKEQLALEALETQWAQMRPRLNEAFSPLLPPLDRIRCFFKQGIDLQVSMYEKAGFVCGCPLISLGCEISTQEPVLRAKVTEILDQKQHYLESAIREAHALGQVYAPDPCMTARIISDYAKGVLTRARIINDLKPVHDLVEGVMAILNPTIRSQGIEVPVP